MVKQKGQSLVSILFAVLIVGAIAGGVYLYTFTAQTDDVQDLLLEDSVRPIVGQDIDLNGLKPKINDDLAALEDARNAVPGPDVESDADATAPQEPQELPAPSEDDSTVSQPSEPVVEDPIPDPSPSITFTGTRLAGTASAPLLDFNSSDYQKAIDSDKLIVLYFYASWCPICRAELPELYGAFDSLTSDNVVGFRVNFNDSDTDSNEEDLARKHGVAYQHTKVFVQNGSQIYKAPDSWKQARYINEIGSRL